MNKDGMPEAAITVKSIENLPTALYEQFLVNAVITSMGWTQEKATEAVEVIVHTASKLILCKGIIQLTGLGTIQLEDPSIIDHLFDDIVIDQSEEINIVLLFKLDDDAQMEIDVTALLNDLNIKRDETDTPPH